MKKTKKWRSIFLIWIILAIGGISIFLGKEKFQESSLPSKAYEIKDGETFSLQAAPARKTIDGRNLKLFTYNSQFPGPLLKVKQNSNIFIDFMNNIDQDTTIHWHGLRHNYKFDGVPDISQSPVQPGESFRYELFFPDAGVFWYHPHIREDIQQERGMYGMIIVEPEEATTIREIPLIFDDMLLKKDDFYPFSKEYTNFALMGRFGNTMLLNGEVQPAINVKQGETVRFYLLNTANVRIFNISIEKTVLQVIGSDIGAFEQPFVDDSVIIAPAERYIMDVRFQEPGTFKILHNNPNASYILGRIVVEEAETQAQPADSLPLTDAAEYRPYFNQSPDFEFSLDIDMRGMVMDMTGMHGKEEPIEWEDTMFQMNQIHNNLMMSWFIEDKKTGRRNMDIKAEVNQGDIKIIRITNKGNSEHPMQHPIHLHGQRFLVFKENGKMNKNLVWKDTVLIPKGSTVDLLVDFSNPGIWMMHCHIAEHLHSGMMMGFDVKEKV